MVGHRLAARPPGRRTAAASAEGGVSKERKRRTDRKRAGEAIKRAHRAAEPVADSGTVPSGSNVEKVIEEGSVDDAEAEYLEKAFAWPIEKQFMVYRRLYKKRANMALVLYHKNHPEEQYQFLRVRLNEVYSFIEYRLQDPYHMHMNFMAQDVKTGLEKTFFAELCMFNDVDDGNSGFVATACEIVDGNSEGKLLLLCVFLSS
ncbi:hypothetical protein HU200_021138 [Digitaria exilis]|uniref:DUF3615 domain-containing protein n=1 Tax=Digitaria exilis TaxID=1010633 RepID=A0A835EZW2_9POAL|nr:hypothetical protein HU200_021138 [Digitaria exilis]